MNQTSSYCGLFNCEQCKFRVGGTCLGCEQGNTFLEKWGRQACSIYSCARSQAIDSCKECAYTVCTLRKAAETICPLRGGMEDKKNWAWRIAHGLKSKGAPCSKGNSVPIKTLMRLRWYITAVDKFAEQGIEVVSSRELADKLGINSAMVRKDFSYLGELGTPGLGYHVSFLQDQIRGILDQHTCLVVWIGAQWFSNVQGMINDSMDLNFQVIGAFDTRREWIGKQIGDFKVLPLSDLPAFVSERSVDGAVLALPEDALRATDMLVQAGLKGILNLTSVMLTTPPEVTVRNIDLIDEMMGLAVDCTEAVAG